MVPLVDRMKKHYKQHEEANNQEDGHGLPAKQAKMSEFVCKTTAGDKAKFDKLVARFFYSCNIPFLVAESAHFKVSRYIFLFFIFFIFLFLFFLFV